MDWFHIVQTFTRALDEVRKREGRVKPLPKHLRWSVLKRGDADHLTTNQLKALAELLDQGLDTANRMANQGTSRLDTISQKHPEQPVGGSRGSLDTLGSSLEIVICWSLCVRH